MLSKKFPVKPKTINFSSEDSQDTDASMHSSIDGNDPEGKYSVANKFNQLRETMNKYFMANPELADELRFEKYSGPEDNYQHNFIQGNDGSQSPKEKLPSPRKINQRSLSTENRDKSPGSKHDNSLKLQTEGAPKLSADTTKLWSTISREMNKGQKNTRAPTSSQVSHMLNLFKQNFEKPAVLDTTMTSPKGIVGNSPRRTHIDKPADFRIQSAKSMKEGGKGKSKDGKGKKGDKDKQDEEDDDGVIYFSVRKKKHLQMKHEIRKQMELNRELRKKEAEERDKQAKERDQKNVMNTLADLDEELNRKGVNANSHANIKEKDDAPARKKRRNSTKQSTNIFDRLTKDGTTRDQDDSINKAPNNKVFTSEIAEELYNDMKAYGNSDSFKRAAQHKLNAFKRDFKENMAKQKTLPTEGLKFTKEDTRYFNTFLPDFERVANYSNKDSVFIHNEVVRGSEEWRENPENELLAKYSRIANGTLFDIWREAKDLNQ